MFDTIVYFNDYYFVKISLNFILFIIFQRKIKETFYASQQIVDHPLAKGLNLEGELFIAGLSYIVALN